jgi:glutamate/aspartate transport system ATP-binding protein
MMEGMNPGMIKGVLDVMVELAQEGMAMIVVTHEMGFAKRFVHRVVFMDQGRIVDEAGKHDFFRAPRLNALGIFWP